MKILKPKRSSNGTYESLIYKNNKKDIITLKIHKAFIIDIKQTNDHDYYLTLKQKSIAKDICIINEKIISYVKDNCGSWFKNNLSDDLIEDYFTSNIMYDKERGQLIRFKCTNDISILSTNTYVDITLYIKLIRFYKQKFVVEWEVHEIEVDDKSDKLLIQSDIEDPDDSDDIDDIPYPDDEELNKSMTETKTRYINLLNHEQLSIQKQISDLIEKKNILDQNIIRLNSAVDFYEVYSICHYLDELLE